MGWIPGMRSSEPASKSHVRTLGAKVAELHTELDVLLFALDADLDLQLLRVQLAAQLAEVGVKSKQSVAGPRRVDAVLSGALVAQKQVLVVLARSDDTAQDRLMDAVEWLIANGRENLVQQLIFVPVGANRKIADSFPFRHVPLSHLDTALSTRGGVPPWHTTSIKLKPLLLAILDQALGLE